MTMAPPHTSARKTGNTSSGTLLISVLVLIAALYTASQSIRFALRYSNSSEELEHNVAVGLKNPPVVTSTPQTEKNGKAFNVEDSDGLKERLQRGWEASDCVYNSTLLPPVIHRTNGTPPLIAPRHLADDLHANKTTARPYMGILLDAARHYFPLEWLYGLVDFLAVLGYDWIHFRIVDDQSFVVKLDCHPELAIAVHPTRTAEIYTAAEMRAFVQYAKSKGISILPEVNIPGHAGGWQGIPGMLLPCTNFICQHGATLPLNIDAPHVLQVIEDVLREVLDVFSTAPYLHLGGDELWMSEPCLNELQVKPDYDAFETKLEALLVQKLNYSTDKVIRWEQTGDQNDQQNQQTENVEAPFRAGKITHWWLKAPTREQQQEEFFTSSGLYFDASRDQDAWVIARIARMRFGLMANGGVIGLPVTKPMKPTAVLSATFELGPCSWNIRNVWGKLVAVAMASSESTTIFEQRSTFVREYLSTCHNLGLSESVCSLIGKPTIDAYAWERKHKMLQNVWKHTVCDRLTYPMNTSGMRVRDTQTFAMVDVIRSLVATSGSRAPLFRRTIANARNTTQEAVRNQAEPRKTPLYSSHVYNYTGIMVDLAHDYFEIETMHRIIDIMSLLGFNLLHLRLVGNEAFAIDLREYHSYTTRRTYTEVEVKLLVIYAAKRGVKIMPEINFLSNAGGWYQSGLLVACPHYVCKVGGPIPVNVLSGRSLYVLSVFSGHLLSLFSTSPFLHLGSADQSTTRACYREAYPVGQFDLQNSFRSFETEMLRIFNRMGMDNNRILRYDSNNETDNFRRVLGAVTHFHQREPWKDTAMSSPFFLSSNVLVDTKRQATAWDIYKHTRAIYDSRATGIIVGTIQMDSESWDTQNVFGRLIAVAAGLSLPGIIATIRDEATFRDHYAKTCQELGLLPGVCDAFAVPLSKIQELNETELKEKKCQEMTQVRAHHIPRTLIFG